MGGPALLASSFAVSLSLSLLAFLLGLYVFQAVKTIVSGLSCPVHQRLCCFTASELCQDPSVVIPLGSFDTKA